MHRETIFVVAADLMKIASAESDNVRVGPETARVCEKAVEVARDRPDAIVHANAGLSPKFQVIMGLGPMRRFLIESGLPPERLETPVAGVFNTDGEAARLVADLFSLDGAQDDTFTIHLVCRWWHLPRARLLLRARIGRERLHDQVWIRLVPVWTFADPIGMLREPLAWIKNLPNFFKGPVPAADP